MISGDDLFAEGGFMERQGCLDKRRGKSRGIAVLLADVTLLALAASASAAQITKCISQN